MVDGEIDLGGRRHVHVVAIGGAAMSAIARMLHQLGHIVTGSDIRDSATLDKLAREGIAVTVGHAAGHVPADCDLVTISTAVRADNPEVVAAGARGIPVVGRGEMMAALVSLWARPVVISGTHGKTSTTSMVTAILEAAGERPSFFIGGTPLDAGTNARAVADSPWIVVEGDESDHSFLAYSRYAALVTNIDADHLERWDDDFGALVRGFESFLAGASGPRVVCADDPVLRELARADAAIVSYGWHADATLRGFGYTPTADGATVDTEWNGEPYCRLRLRTHGRDMAQNALGAAALSAQLGIEAAVVAGALGSFGGVRRRFEWRASIGGAEYYDDYAHTPTEIAATLARAKEVGAARVVAVCQPHRYSRVSQHWREYGGAFRDADVIVITPLDPAFEDPIPGVSAQLVVDAVRADQPGTELHELQGWDDLRRVPSDIARAGDIVITLGCGTITEAHDLWAGGAA
jgi:UDP-N-acetylmuramate--alanine ligase